MSTTTAMINAHPNPTDGLDVDQLAETIDAVLTCADICATTARLLSRRTGSNLAVLKAQLEACRTACATCAKD